MAQKEMNSRIVLKHDIERNWQAAAARSNFTPKLGEIIIYDIDENYNHERIKIGDGVRNVEDLPFYAGSWEDLGDKPFGETNPIEITWDGVIGDNFVIQEWAGFGDYYIGDYGITDYTQLLGSIVKLGDDTYTLDYCEPPEYTDGYYELRSNEESYAKVRLVTENNADSWPIGIYFYYTPDTHVSYLKTNPSIKKSREFLVLSTSSITALISSKLVTTLPKSTTKKPFSFKNSISSKCVLNVFPSM